MFVRLAEGRMATRGQSQRAIGTVRPPSPEASEPPRGLSAFLRRPPGPGKTSLQGLHRVQVPPGHRGVLSGLPGLHPPRDDTQKCAQTSPGVTRGQRHGGPLL